MFSFKSKFGKAHRRAKFSAHMPGGLAITTPHPNGLWTAIKLRKNDAETVCGFRMPQDTEQQYGWCVDGGWQGRENGISGEWEDGRQFFDEVQAEEFTTWVVEAADSIEEVRRSRLSVLDQTQS